MARTIHTTKEPVTLDGFQAILAPSKFGYSLSAIVDTNVIDVLDTERADVLKWAESKLKNPKRSTCRPEPWEEVAKGKYIVKFSWAEDKKPPIVDTEGTPITDVNTPIYEGSKVKLGFTQKPYLLRDGVTYGTSLKIAGIQVVSVKGGAGVDSGDLDDAGVAELFGKCTGYKASDPNVVANDSQVTDDDF